MSLRTHKQSASDFATISADAHDAPSQCRVGVEVLSREWVALLACLFLRVSASLFQRAILHIVLLGSYLEMAGIAAWRIVTSMANHLFGVESQAKPQESDDSMHPEGFSEQVYGAISVVVSRSHPKPASRGVVDNNSLFHCNYLTIRNALAVGSLIVLMGAQGGMMPGPGTPHSTGGGANTITPDPTLSNTTTSATTTMAVTTSAVMPALGTAVIDVAWFGVQTLTSCVGSSGIFTQQGSTVAWYSATGNQAWGFVTGATAGSALTVTCTFSATLAAAFPNMQIAEIHGSISGPVVDSAAAATSGTINLGTSGSVTTSIANEFIWSVCDGSGNVTPGATPQAMTQLNPSAGANPFIIQYGTAVTAGSNTATCTLTGGGSGQWVITLAAMK